MEVGMSEEAKEHNQAIDIPEDDSSVSESKSLYPIYKRPKHGKP